MRFEWDEEKNRQNRRKHGIWFEEAQGAFEDPAARFFLDPDHSDEEDRFLLFGRSPASGVLVVVHCYRGRGSIIRLISARRATRKERKDYAEGI